MRNAIGSGNALISADLALAGVESQIPVDEVIGAMDRVGRNLPASLRETGFRRFSRYLLAKKLNVKYSAKQTTWLKINN